jgi:hypothetical protein
VLVLIDGVVYVLFPLNKAVPPVAVLYQSIAAPLEVALRVTVPAPHRDPAVTVGLAGTVFTVASTGVRATDTQPVAAIRAWA